MSCTQRMPVLCYLRTHCIVGRDSVVDRTPCFCYCSIDCSQLRSERHNRIHNLKISPATEAKMSSWTKGIFRLLKLKNWSEIMTAFSGKRLMKVTRTPVIWHEGCGVDSSPVFAPQTKLSLSSLDLINWYHLWLRSKVLATVDSIYFVRLADIWICVRPSVPINCLLACQDIRENVRAWKSLLSGHKPGIFGYTWIVGYISTNCQMTISSARTCLIIITFWYNSTRCRQFVSPINKKERKKLERKIITVSDYFTCLKRRPFLTDFMQI